MIGTMLLKWTMPAAAALYVLCADGVPVYEQQGSWPAGTHMGLRVDLPDTLEHAWTIRYLVAGVGLSEPSNVAIGAWRNADTLHAITYDGAPVSWRVGPGFIGCGLRLEERRAVHIEHQETVQRRFAARIRELYGCVAIAGVCR